MKKKQFIFLILTLIVLGSNNLLSQGIENVRSIRKHGLSLKAGGDYTLLGIAYDCFLSPKTNFELNASLAFPGFGASFYYHPWGDKNHWRWSPYLGIHGGYNNVGFWDSEDVVSVYLPLGVNYISDRGFNLSADIGLWYNNYSYEYIFAPWASVKLGYRFYNGNVPYTETKRSKSKRKRKTNIRKDYKYGLSLATKGTLLPLGLIFDMFVKPQLEGEICVFSPLFGINDKATILSFGANFHPWGGRIDKKLSPYFGLHYGIHSYTIYGFSEYDDSFYVPIGLSYIDNSRFYISVDAGYLLKRETNYYAKKWWLYREDPDNYTGGWDRISGNYHRFNFSIKLGYRF